MNYLWAVLAYGVGIFLFGWFMEGRSRRRGRGPARPHSPPDPPSRQTTPNDERPRTRSAAAASMR